MLLEFLYAHRFPEREDCGHGLGAGEMAQVADRFQAVPLYEHCIGLFREGLRVLNVAERLVIAHDSGLEELQETAIVYLKNNAYAFQVSCSKKCLDSVPAYLRVNLPLLFEPMQ